MGVFNNWPYTDVHQLNLDFILDTMKDVKGKTDQIDSAVETATTAAENAAESARQAAILAGSFVTPEMFGAVGDGVTDDTAAIQEALNSGNRVILFTRSYKTSESVTLKASNTTLCGGGTIAYYGSNYALILNGEYINVSINVAASNGYAIKIDATVNSWCQYIRFFNMHISALNDCVTCLRDNTRWVNELSFINVRFNGERGFYFPGDYNNNGFKFVNCADEECTDTFIEADKITGLMITNIRLDEVIFLHDFIRINNELQKFVIVSDAVNVERIILPTNTRNIGYVMGVIYNNQGQRLGCNATVYNGGFIIDNWNTPKQLSVSDDSYDYVEDIIVPAVFELLYAEGGHAYTIKLPFEYYAFKPIILHTIASANTVAIYEGGTLLTTLSFSGGSGYYKVEKVGTTLISYKLAPNS